MAPSPEHVRIRSYNVGFGDCFLVTFTYARAKPRNVLIDFGSTMQAPAGPPGGMLEIAQQIEQDCDGKLNMVVATHRHADHISGFAGDSGAIIRSLHPDLVAQPWTEDPNLDPDAKAPAAASSGGSALRARTLVSRLSDMQAMAESVLAQVPRLEASKAAPASTLTELRFLGETNLKNAESVRNLMTMGKKTVYASFGTKLPVSGVLPGVRLDVIGPPTLEQSAAISHQAQTDPDEFWHLAARGLEGAGALGPAAIFEGKPLARRIPQEARWTLPHIDALHADEMLAIVRSLDSVLNNTSLILLFQIGDSVFVFPGDAQIENWSYALRDAKEADAIRKRLAAARFYKVGHHGSLNATPKTLWNGFEHRHDGPSPDRLATMVSTASGKHGSVARGTEVPRSVLIDELKKMSDLKNTQSLKRNGAFWNDVDLDV